MADEVESSNPGTGAGAGGNENSPQYGEWYQQIPEQVRGSIPNEVLKNINDGWMRNADYTQKRQADSEWIKLREDFKGRDLKREIAELDQWRDWRRKDWDNVEAQLKDYERLKATQQPATPSHTDPVLFNNLSPDDFYEAERLKKALATMETGFAQAANQAWQQKWEREQLPGIQQYANNLSSQMLGLLKLAWPEHLPPIDEVLKQAYASGSTDFGSVLQNISTERKSSEEKAMEKARTKVEAELRANGWQPPAAPPGVGGGTSWGRPPAASKMDADKLFSHVMQEVAKKHGPIPI